MEKILSEDYCSFELSKLLKEKGFDEKCPSYYRVQDSKIDLLWNHFEGKLISNSELNQYFVSAPTHQMAMKWLREKRIFVLPDVRIADGKWFYMIVKRFEEVDNGCTGERSATGYYDTYEEAVEAAILYVLSKVL